MLLRPIKIIEVESTEQIVRNNHNLTRVHGIWVITQNNEQYLRIFERKIQKNHFLDQYKITKAHGEYELILKYIILFFVVH